MWLTYHHRPSWPLLFVALSLPHQLTIGADPSQKKPVSPLAQAPIDRRHWWLLLYRSRKGFNPMNKKLLDDISIAFYNLSQTNKQLYDYWLFELYDSQGDMIVDRWNQESLYLMEKDVMNQFT